MELEPLRLALQDRDARAREAAAEALRSVSQSVAKDSCTIDALIAALNDADRGVRRAAARALGHLRLPRVDAVLARDYPAWHIVYVEDDELIVEMTKRLLLSSANLKFVVHSAYKGSDGLTLIHQVKPDVVLLDVELPELGGVEIYQQMRRDLALRYIPVIVFTADESPGVLARFADVDAFLVKPLDIRELLQTIEGVLRGRAWA